VCALQVVSFQKLVIQCERALPGSKVAKALKVIPLVDFRCTSQFVTAHTPLWEWHLVVVMAGAGVFNGQRRAGDVQLTMSRVTTSPLGQH
jgi:hypothetical protein